MHETIPSRSDSRALAQWHIPRWDELPDIALYMDQVISQLDKYLSPLATPEAAHCVTASMINNYVKLQLLPPPVKKRYGRVHLAHLVAICLLKQVLSIPEVKALLEQQLFACSSEKFCAAYNDFCASQERAFADMCSYAAQHTAAEQSALAVELAVRAGAGKVLAQALLCEKTEPASTSHKAP